jgi:3-keto-5-aminohexanoate cleavage enzyme
MSPVSAQEPVVITAALVGAEVTREQTPYLPITPEEIALEARRAWEAGAAVVHLHMREPDGRPSQSARLFDETIRRIRAETDLVVQTSTGGALGMSLDDRCQPLTLTPPPDMATLNAGSCNFGDDVFVNTRPMIREIARRIRERGIVPEIEVYEVGHLDTILDLAAAGDVELPAHFQFVMGVKGAIAARPAHLRYLVSNLPPGCTFTVAGVGRHQFPMAELAVELGGNVRVGLEDNIYLSRGVLAKGNAELVARAAEIVRAAGRAVATPAEARRILRVRAPA